MPTTPDVFIIESLKPIDEQYRRQEGEFLSHILNQTGVNTEYHYVRTLEEFVSAIQLFGGSAFRYLHISCHANPIAIGIGNEGLSTDALCKVMKDNVEKRRIFFSACKLVRKDFARKLLSETKCYSVIGPSRKIGFDESAIFWASLYHVMLRNDASGMKFAELHKQVRIFAALYEVKIRYFRSSKLQGSREVDLVPSKSLRKVLGLKMAKKPRGS